MGDTEGEQLAQALRNVSAILEAAGTTLDRAASATLIMANSAGKWGQNFRLRADADMVARFSAAP